METIILIVELVGLATFLTLGILSLPIMSLNVPAGKVAVLYLKWSINGPSERAVAYHTEEGPENKKIIKFKGSGYLKDLYNPGFYLFVYSPIFHRVEMEDWVRNDATAPAYVISQIGDQLDAGRRFVFMDGGPEIFNSVEGYLEKDGRIGEHAMVLGSFNQALHPAAFLVITKKKVFGFPYNADLMAKKLKNQLTFADFGYTEADFDLNVVEKDKIGLVTLQDGKPNPKGFPVYKHGGWDEFVAKHEELCKKHGLPVSAEDLAKEVESVTLTKEEEEEKGGKTEDVLMAEKDWVSRWPKELSLGTELLRLVREWNNEKSNNYQQPGKDAYAGPQWVPILEGRYLHNRHLVRVEEGEYTSVNADSALAIVTSAGPDGFDITPANFTYNKLVRPGFVNGIWSVAFGPGAKYPLNRRFLELDEWITSVLVLYWSQTESEHGFDTDLDSIRRLSKDKVNMVVDLNVRLAIPMEAVPFCRARFGTQKRFINEFMKAVVTSFVMDFIENHTAEEILTAQEELGEILKKHLVDKLKKYHIDVQEVLFEKIEPEESYYKVVNARTLADVGLMTVKAETTLATAEITRNTERGKAKAAQTIEEAKGSVEARRIMIEAVKNTVNEQAATAVAVAQELVGGKHAGVPSALALSGTQSMSDLIPFLMGPLNSIKDALSGGQTKKDTEGSDSAKDSTDSKKHKSNP